jgi:hypothetical protein
MFAALKSLLSVHVAPGGAYVDVRPFSFAWFTRITIRANAGDNEIERTEIIESLKAVEQHLLADRLVEGRELLVLTIEKMVKE